jgi:hypothetical protein
VPYDPLMRWEWEGGAVLLEDHDPVDSKDEGERPHAGERGVSAAERRVSGGTPDAAADAQRVASTTKIAAAT